MANQRPTLTTQSLSVSAYTGPDGHPVASGTYGTFFLGRYRVVDEIGVGGMASVHLARLDGAGGFQKWVAIKRIHPHLVEDDQFVHMFLDEARIAARISHANVAQVFELGDGDGNYWIAMEYLHGEPLREVMRAIEDGAPAMGYEIAARIIADSAEGLHAAHDLRGKNGELMGLVHRDVTPHNLFVTYEGTVKVVDFGIAKVAGRLSSTRAGTLKGKLAYMSPEQVQGKEIDRRTDVFALGVVLWELTTNQRLFRTDSDLETLEKVQACVVPRPSSYRRDYPPALEAILLKTLSKDPAARFQTARDLARELQKFLLQRGALVGPEDVSSYVHQIFGDRIQKRDEHLRWAAEVTQTVSAEEFQRQQQGIDVTDASAVSYASEVQPARAGRPGAPSPVAPMTPAMHTPAPLPSLRAGSPGLPAMPAMKGTMKLPAIGAPPSGLPMMPPPSMPPGRSPIASTTALPTFGARPPAPLPPSVPPPAQVPSFSNYEDDDEDENLQTLVTSSRNLLIDDSNPTIARADHLALLATPPPAAGSSAYAVPAPAAGAPAYAPPPTPGYPAQGAQGYPSPQAGGYAPGGVPAVTHQVSPYAAPAANPYAVTSAPPVQNQGYPPNQQGYPPNQQGYAPNGQQGYPGAAQGYPAPGGPQGYQPAPGEPPLGESPTYAAPNPMMGRPIGEAQPTPEAKQARDGTMLVPLVREKKQLGLVALATMVGTLLIVGVVAFGVMRHRGGTDESTKDEPKTDKPVADTPATPSATAPPPTTTAPTVVAPPPTTAAPPPTETAPVAAPPPTSTSKAPATPTPPTPATTDKKPVDKPADKPPEKKEEGSGTLTVVCRPACDSVTVRGRNLGPSPLINIPLPAGTHTVTLKKSGSPSQSTAVTIRPGANTPLRVNM